MPKLLDFPNLVARFRVLLMSRGAMAGTEARQALGISQASFSRLVDKMKGDLITIGQARRTKYALRNAFPRVGDRIPLYLITGEGRAAHLGILHPLAPKGFYLEPKRAGIREAVFPDLPYFLDDLRPSGFLGRQIPKSHPELEAPENILAWSVEDCFSYWTRLGWNLVGNLLVGDRALRLFLEHPSAAPVGSRKAKTKVSYAKFARDVLLHGEAGSSAGGEQAKFIVEHSSVGTPALVKFSPPVQDEISRRVADLLICEHLCHEILSRHGFVSASSRILKEERQVFLEVERFDRVGASGRRGLISLRALSAEFVGTLESWRAISAGLLKAKMISEEMHSLIRQLEIFGELIANSDMHAGNLSLYLDEKLEPAGLAPVYDMLPMMYYPRQNQILEREYAPKIPIPGEFILWRKASDVALAFWEKVSNHSEISTGFRNIAKDNLKKLSARIEAAESLLG